MPIGINPKSANVEERTMGIVECTGVADTVDRYFVA